MTPSLLPAYFARVGYAGEAKPTFAVLESLHRLHPAAIPFENLDPFLARPVDIAPDAVAAKLIASKRGGYCFEQNSLFHDVLATLGFSVSPRAGRVIWNAPQGAPRPALTHRITKVSLPEGDYITDVGFGGQSPTAPLRLVADLEQATSHGCFRFLLEDSVFELQVRTAEGWRGMYRFADEIQGQPDFDVANWFTSTHPRSRFRNNLVAARVIGEKRFNLLNRTVTNWSGDGPGETRVLTGPADLEQLLVGMFGLALPADAAVIWEKTPST